MTKKPINLLRRKFRAKPKPAIPLGPYTKPVVIAIKLDPEQAIIAACQVVRAGRWIFNLTMCVNQPWYYGGACNFTPKGEAATTPIPHCRVAAVAPS